MYSLRFGDVFMRSKDTGLMQKIKDFCEGYYLEHNQSPSCICIGEEFGITRNTAYRYLVEMREKGMIDYENGSIHTEKTNKVNAEFSSAALVGSIPCGSPEEEFEEIQEIVQLPVSVSKNALISICDIFGQLFIFFFILFMAQNPGYL